jgi:hypothetical protein
VTDEQRQSRDEYHDRRESARHARENIDDWATPICPTCGAHLCAKLATTEATDLEIDHPEEGS